MGCYNDFALVYDKLLSGDVDYKKWADFILNLCDEYKIHRDSYLDLACGTGNMTVELSSKFKETWAVDLSEEMLSIADTKLNGRGQKARILCEDICNLKLNKLFNLATCCLDSTNYITSDDELFNYFRGVYDHLSNNGLFIFDINSYYKISTILGNNTYNYDEDGIVYIWENFFENETVDMYLTFFIKDGELYRRVDEYHSERAFKEEEIEKYLYKAGFKLLKKLDCYEDKNISQYTERITYVAMK